MILLNNMATSKEQFPLPMPTVAIVGRMNVGKSTLFNRLIESQKAMVSDIPGTTRTNNEGMVLWRGHYIRLIDTGGLSLEKDVAFETEIVEQSEQAMKKADLILFIIDAKSGPMPQEFELAKRLRRKKQKPILLIANKVDNKRISGNLSEPEWYKLGMGEPFPISASNGRNIGDLLDTIYEQLQLANKQPTLPQEQADTIQIALIGKPNVGKSSLFNKLIGEEKVIVSDVAHTTREPHDTLVTYTYSQMNESDVEGVLEKTREDKTQLMNFIDTAGIRRKSHVRGTLEKQGIHKSVETLEKSDIILFVVDSTEDISSQDMQLGGLIERRSKSVIILINKWDLSDDISDKQQQEIKRRIYTQFPHLDFAELLFVSGKKGTGIHKIFPLIMRIWEARHTKIPVKALEYFLRQVTSEHRPARGKGTKHPKLMGIRQIHESPPIFELFVKAKTSLHRSYLNYLENKLREQFNFLGTPLVIKLTKVKR